MMESEIPMVAEAGAGRVEADRLTVLGGGIDGRDDQGLGAAVVERTTGIGLGLEVGFTRDAEEMRNGSLPVWALMGVVDGSPRETLEDDGR